MTTSSVDHIITSHDTIEEILNKFPSKAQKLAHELNRWGLQCVGCSAATWETVEAGMLKHGKSEQDIEKLLVRLNSILQESADEATVSLTPRAAEIFRKIAEAEGVPEASLQFGEHAAGCSGFEYTLDFVEPGQSSQDDLMFESHGVRIYVHKHSLARLLGCQIDYVDGLHSGFKISNPNVRSSCGCGSSHGY